MLAFVKTRDVLVVTAWCPVPRLAIAEAQLSELLLKRDRKLSHLIPALNVTPCILFFSLCLYLQHSTLDVVKYTAAG